MRFEQGDEVTAEVVFADGNQSLGRRLLFPDVGLRHRGYQLWRGLLPEAALADPDVLGSNCPRISYPTMPGNFVCYFVPGEDGSVQPGEPAGQLGRLHPGGGRRTLRLHGRSNGPNNNIQSLLEVLEHHDDPETALEEWGEGQVRLADRLLALGDQMEQAFIWDSLDLTMADAASTRRGGTRRSSSPTISPTKLAAELPPSGLSRPCVHREGGRP